MVDDAAGLAWIVNLGCIELHPHPVRVGRPRPSRRAARRSRSRARASRGTTCARVALEVQGAARGARASRGWPKTSGSRGMHVNVRIEPRWTFTEVRRAALALSREVERRAPGARDVEVVEGGAPRRLPRLQPERQGSHDVLGVLGAPAARRARLGAARVGRGARLRPGRLHRRSRCRARFAAIGDPHAEHGRARGLARALLELAARDEAAGLGDAPWPPHFRKMEGEAPRVAPSRARSGAAKKPPRDEDAARRRRELARQGGGARRPRALEGAAPRGRGAPRGRRRARRLDARPLVDLDAHPRQPAARARGRCARRRRRPIPDDDPTREWREHANAEDGRLRRSPRPPRRSPRARAAATTSSCS